MLTQYQLEMYAEKFLKDNYNMRLTVPLKLNGRMRTTCGWFKSARYYDGSKKAVSVELNKFFVENNEPEMVLDVLRHELVHYALFMQGKPNDDGHPVFENELKMLGIVSQSTIDKYEIKSKPVNIVIYECQSCNKQYKRRRKLPNDGVNHRCGGGCGGNLINKGRELVTS